MTTTATHRICEEYLYTVLCITLVLFLCLENKLLQDVVRASDDRDGQQFVAVGLA
jgi:hypothetical protein